MSNLVKRDGNSLRVIDQDAADFIQAVAESIARGYVEALAAEVNRVLDVRLAPLEQVRGHLREITVVRTDPDSGRIVASEKYDVAPAGA